MDVYLFYCRILTGVSEMVKKIARSMTENEQKMLMYITLTCGIVSKFAELSMPNLDVVKTLRMSVCDRLAEMFHAFPDRQLLSEEVRILKDVIISSHLNDLQKSTVVEREDSNYLPVVPFSVVKLAAAICKLPTLYQILTINLEWNIIGETDKRTCDVIDILLAPLLWPGCFDLMFRTIRGAIMRLSELADENRIDIGQFVKCSDVQIAKKSNYGTSLLQTRIRFVLDFLTMQIEKEVASNKRPSSESITLLERFSDFVSEFEDIPNRLATPLLMCIERLKCNEETMVNMLKSMARIAPILKDPQQYFGKLPKLFSKMAGRTLRDGLVEMVQGFSKSKNIDEKTSNLLQLICDLDSWDKSKVDEPNFDKRYAAYHSLMDIWTSKDHVRIDPIILGMFVGTHFQCISTTTDLSLRMTAGNNVRSLVEFSGKSLEGNEKRGFLESFLNPTVIFFMKHETDAVREEALSTLGVMVRSFKENQHLAELGSFTNDQDEELDFLKNMNHIQIHRRQKAIRKLIENIENGEKNISFNAMFKYLIPMINPYLINFSAKFNAISDESLRLLTLTMSKAPWGKYCSYLESWLSRVEKATGSSGSNSSQEDEFTDKALVRIVVAVIDAFHFDVNEKVENNEGIDEENENENDGIILKRINRVILPRLTKCLDSQTHNVERKAKTLETQATTLHLDIQRTPIAFAIVKLLQKLPDAVIGRHLHGVILKICNLMMTHSFDVRETARKTLLQIVKCLGSKYLASIITEISLTMTKGFQVHVAIYSIHTLIVAMKSVIKNGELDTAINVIVKLCIQDQFSSTSEEKQIGSIKAECPEAKGNRTPETLMHLGRFVSPAGIQTVLDPFRTVVNEHPSAKAIQKVSDLLSKFASGLKDNEGLDNSNLLTYIYKSLSNDLQKLGDVESKNEEKEKSGRRPESCLILPAAPKRIGAMTKVVIRSRDHVFAEFFVHLFAAILKEKKLDLNEDGMIARLNPFVNLILNCFDYKYEKLIAGSLRALCSMIQIQLSAISTNSQRVSDTLFILLSDYASIGQAGNKPEIVKLNQLIYKGFTNLINISGCDFLDNDKLTLLLAYAEADVLDQHKQATMFSLIKILVKKGVRHERLSEIMDHLAETSIRSPLINIRAQCRETLLDYIGGASDSDKSVEKFVEFFLDQLDYEYETGRQSAAEMLCQLFRNLLSKSLENVHMLCVVKLGAAIMNDESPKVSAQIGIALRNLLSNVGTSQRNETFEVILQWLETEDENARAVAIQTTVQLSFVEKEKMTHKIGKIFENLKNILFDENLFENTNETTIISMLNGITRILANVGKQSVTQFDPFSFLEALGDLAKCEESISVMCAASTLIGQILSFIEIENISENLAKEISLWMCRALRHSNLDIATGEQTSKNLVCLSKRLDIETYKLIIANIAQSCKYEVKHQVKQVVKRISCFKLIAALFVTGDSERSNCILEKFMSIFVRELRTCRDEELSNLTQEVCGLIKKKIGDDEYSRRVGECQKSASDKITDRKRKIRELAVTAPEDAAELRRKKNKKKMDSRKRKLDEMKPYRMMKRKHAETRKLQENEED
ncbi:unnamed protein product [Caenorhabditis angaria]|uniref:Uncharacterized protein n=1 Tax=Caenorhabditis angaria TaxID=860376 RepID=A0A9P1IAS7_9PELO|nr:unnamed protein product [Caenorhabditis angaria]